MDTDSIGSDFGQVTFIAPDVEKEGVTLVFQLTVTDAGGLKSADSCIVNIVSENNPPFADAGKDQTVNEGSSVTLSGSGSSDQRYNHGFYGHLFALLNNKKKVPTYFFTYNSRNQFIFNKKEEIRINTINL